MKSNSQQFTTIGIGLGLALVAGSYYFLVYKKRSKQKVISDQGSRHLTKGQKITKEKGKSESTLQQYDADKPFNQEYVQDVKRLVYPKQIKELDQSTAKKFAAQIYKADGFFIDDLGVVLDIFQRKITDKVQVSNLSKIFYDEYNGKDLWKFIAGMIGRRNMRPMIEEPIGRLPDYQIKD